MTDQEPIAAAIQTALNTALAAEFTAGGVEAFEKDGIPGKYRTPGETPDVFVVLELRRHPMDAYRGGADGLPGFYLDTTYRADSVTNCRRLRRVVSATLEAQLIGEFGFVFNDESQPIDDDPDGGWSGVDTWQLA